MDSDKITTLSAAMMILTSGGILNHVIIIPMLLQAAGRDAWLSVILTGLIIVAVWIPLMLLIMKRSRQQQLHAWLQQRLGKAASWLIAGLAAIHFFIICWLTMRDVTYWAKVSYLPNSPKAVITVTFILVILALAGAGLRSIAVANGILLPVIIVLGLFVMTANFPHKDYRLMFPLFEHGQLPLLRGMIYAGAGLAEVLYFVFIQHRLKSNLRFLPLAAVGLLLVELTLGPLLGTIAIFGPEESARMRFPSYEQWRLVTFGHFFEHIDFLSIYQWLSGACIRISLALYIVLDMLNLTAPKRRNTVLILLAAALAVASQYPVSDSDFSTVLSVYVLPGSLIFLTVFAAVLAAVALTERNKAGENA